MLSDLLATNIVSHHSPASEEKMLFMNIERLLKIESCPSTVTWLKKMEVLENGLLGRFYPLLSFPNLTPNSTLKTPGICKSGIVNPNFGIGELISDLVLITLFFCTLN